MPLPDQKVKLPQIKILLKQYKDDKVKVLHLDNVLVDSGASTNFISRSVVPQQFETIKLDQPITLTNAVRDEMSVLKYKLEANVCIPQDQIEVPCVDFTIIEDPVTYAAILGYKFIQNHKIDFSGNTPEFLNLMNTEPREFLNLIQLKPTFFTKSLQVDENVTLYPFTDTWVKTKKPKNNPWPEEHKLAISKELDEKQIILEQGKIKADYKLKLKNRSENVIIIKKGTSICHVVPLDEDIIAFEHLNFLIAKKDLSSWERVEHDQEYQRWRKVRNHLTKEISIESEIAKAVKDVPAKYSQELRSILDKYQWYFSRSADDSGLSANYCAELLLSSDDKRPTYT